MANKESLIIELDAKTATLDAKLKRTEDNLDNVEKATTKVDKSLVSLSSAAKFTAKGIAVMATAAFAVSTAIDAMVLSSARNRRELELLSSQAKTSTSDFQALSFATNQYGINAEQIADISKDIADKIGEFAAVGTGTFQDYADVIKLTKEEAQKTAIEFQSLSSQEVIGKMVSEMEKAGVTADKMTFVLESMGNDLSRLAPLFANNSRELLTLKKRFTDINETLVITDLQADKLKEVSTSFELMTAQIGNATTAISATLAPVMDDFFNDVISVVPQATQTIIDFINSFLDAENITTIAAVDKQIQESQGRILELQEEKTALSKQDTSFRKDSGEFNQRAIVQLQEAIDLERVRTAELNEQLGLLEGQKKQLEDAKGLKGGQIGGEVGEDISTGTGTGDQIQAIADRFKEEEDLLIEKLARELEIIGDNNELKLALEDEFLIAIVNLDQEAEDRKKKARKDAAKDKIKIDINRQKTEQSLERKNISSIMSITSALLGHNSVIGKALFIASQGLAISEVFFNTQVASARALAELGPIAGAPVAAAIQTSGNLSMAAIAATTLGSLASSGSSGSLSPSSPETATQQQQQDFQQETTTQELGINIIGDDASTSVENFTFNAEGGSDADEFMAMTFNDALRSGRITVGR